MDIWFEIKAGRRSVSETGQVKEEIEASQLAHLTAVSDNLIGLVDIYDEGLVTMFRESLKIVKFNLLHKRVNQSESATMKNFWYTDKLRKHRSFLIKGAPVILDNYLLFTPDLNLDFFNRIREGHVVWFNPKTTRDMAICIGDGSKNKIVVFHSEYKFEPKQETTEVWIVGSSCEDETV